MPKVNQTLTEQNDLGWSIHIYGGDRRLLFSLYPSHGWIFCLGLMLGFLTASLVIEPNMATRNTSELNKSNAPQVITNPPTNAPLNVD